jgi:hypothetical protein
VAWVLLALVLMAGAAVTFFARNGHQTRLDFLFYTKTAPTRWLVLTCLALGALVDRLAVHAWRRRRRRRSRA